MTHFSFILLNHIFFLLIYFFILFLVTPKHSSSFKLRPLVWPLDIYSVVFCPPLKLTFLDPTPNNICDTVHTIGMEQENYWWYVIFRQVLEGRDYSECVKLCGTYVKGRMYKCIFSLITNIYLEILYFSSPFLIYLSLVSLVSHSIVKFYLF